MPEFLQQLQSAASPYRLKDLFAKLFQVDIKPLDVVKALGDACDYIVRG